MSFEVRKGLGGVSTTSTQSNGAWDLLVERIWMNCCNAGCIVLDMRQN